MKKSKLTPTVGLCIRPVISILASIALVLLAAQTTSAKVFPATTELALAGVPKAIQTGVIDVQPCPSATHTVIMDVQTADTAALITPGAYIAKAGVEETGPIVVITSVKHGATHTATTKDAAVEITVFAGIADTATATTVAQMKHQHGVGIAKVTQLAKITGAEEVTN